MSLTIAAVGAVVAAILESTLLRYVEIGGAHPHVVLVYAVLWTTVAGLDGGLTAAFVGGLTIDSLALRPFGSTAFALLVAVGLASAIARTFVRGRLLVPPVAVLVSSIVSSAVLLAVYGALRSPIPVADPLAELLPGAVYDTLLAALIAPLAIAIHDRATASERVDW